MKKIGHTGLIIFLSCIILLFPILWNADGDLYSTLVDGISGASGRGNNEYSTTSTTKEQGSFTEERHSLMDALTGATKKITDKEDGYDSTDTGETDNLVINKIDDVSGASDKEASDNDEGTTTVVDVITSATKEKESSTTTTETTVVFNTTTTSTTSSTYRSTTSTYFSTTTTSTSTTSTTSTTTTTIQLTDYEKAFAAYRREDYNRAFTLFSDLLQSGNKSGPVYLYRGICGYYKGQYRQALDDCSRAAELDRSSLQSYLFAVISAAHISRTEMQRARNRLLEGISRFSEDWEKEMARYFAGSEKPENVLYIVNDIKDPVKHNEFTARTYFYIGMYEKLYGNSKNAQTCFAISERTGNPDIDEVRFATHELQLMKRSRR